MPNEAQREPERLLKKVIKCLKKTALMMLIKSLTA